MAQSAITVRLDSEMKSQFDELCEQFGMSVNTAFNIFVKAVIRSRSIPFAIRGSRTEAPNALDLFMQQRRAAEASQEPEMTLDEINAEIRTAREERPQKQKMAHPDFSVAAPLTAIATHREWSATTYPKILHTR